ncbi:hypothetical protein Kirov_117 [Bacillus phage Kirov]|uniref:Uncharacterized protein n=1 Tax=Bacillus phage Kirov TaxID=2783539 RepID=A0A7U3NKG4_9CAUD|nr:hypothetical protein PQE67_gp187 [Bacillus phage Kirov]QOV08316.1 hypothetical protein Kirov_117 [Bacillus phage Kirov]
MAYMYVMGFLSWTFMIFLLTGFMVSQMFESDLRKEITDEERMKIETIMMPFWNAKFSGKVYWLLDIGVSTWTILLEPLLNKLQRKKDD